MSYSGANKVAKLTAALLFEGILLALIVRDVTVEAGNIPIKWWTIVLIGVGIGISNIASAIIVGFLKDEILWTVVEREIGPDENGRSVRQQWSDLKLMSPVSKHIGIAERVLLVVAGVASWTAFATAAGGWLALKVSCNWRAFGEIKHRAVSDVYLIASVASVLLGGIDVLAVRTLFDMTTLLN